MAKSARQFLVQMKDHGSLTVARQLCLISHFGLIEKGGH
jgi:hypothetical protein